MTITKPLARRPRLTHAIAELFPPQGQWSEDEYFELSDRASRLIELSNGKWRCWTCPLIHINIPLVDCITSSCAF